VNIILHEGKDDKKYIKRICTHLKIEVTDEIFYELGNKSNFFKEDHLAYKNIENNPRISKILFVLDIDYEKNDHKSGGYSNTRNKIEQIIKKLELDSISDYYLACDPNTRDGYFESLLLSCTSDELKKCYNDFMKCSGYNGKENQKTVITKLHELASPEKPYDYNHKNFDEIKEKLQELFA
jgi:hypothetical protein